MDIDKIVSEVKKRLVETNINWDGLGSPKPTDKCIKKTVEVIQKLLEESLVPNAIGPSFSGGATVVFRSRSNKELVIEINHDASIDIILIDGSDAVLDSISAERESEIPRIVKEYAFENKRS